MPLALFAMVLLATLPTVGRLVSGGMAHAEHAPLPMVAASAGAIAAHGTHRMSGMHDMPGMHHMSGMTHAMVMAPAHAMRAVAAVEEHTPDPRSSGDHHAGHGIDCDYCPLLHSLLGALALVLLGTDEDALPAPAFQPATARVPWHYPAGLGSRGPPARS